MRVSVAVPVFNEEKVIPELIRRLDTVLRNVPGGPHELIIVDDGSSDRTCKVLVEHVGHVPGLRVVQLSRNFGHQAAITAALDHVSGDVVIVMDGDLQDPPEAIPDLLAAHHAGADVVYVVRASRREAWPLRLAYAVFYRMLQRMSYVRIPVDAGDFALLSSRVVKELRGLPERHRFLRGLRAWVGFTQQALRVDRGERAGGKSKYSLVGLIRLASDGLFAFSTWPIRATMAIGGAAIVGAGVFAAYAVGVKAITGQVPVGFTSTIVVTVFLAGMNLFFMGVIGEYVGRIYDEVKQRPHYIVGRIYEVGSSDG